MIATAFCGCDDNEDKIIPITSGETEAAVGETDTVQKDRKGDEKPEDEPSSKITVYVCGAVRNPDVYVLDSKNRIVDAVSAAGGFMDDAGTEYLNLAAGLSDGQKVYIPTVAQIEEALYRDEELYSAEVNITSNIPSVGSENNSGRGGGEENDVLVDINHADRETLMTLPGIGQSKADKIISYRESNGGFSSIEDIMLVGGIKEGLYNKVKDRICVR